MLLPALKRNKSHLKCSTAAHLSRNNVPVTHDNPQNKLSTVFRGPTSLVQRGSSENCPLVCGLSKVTGALFPEICATVEFLKWHSQCDTSIVLGWRQKNLKYLKTYSSEMDHGSPKLDFKLLLTAWKQQRLLDLIIVMKSSTTTMTPHEHMDIVDVVFRHELICTNGSYI